jgi:hypothetical protein
MMVRELLTPKLLHLNEWVIFSSSSYMTTTMCVQCGQSQSGEKVPEILTYGVTFPAEGYDKALPVLDSLLERYSHFSSPTLIHGDKAKEEQLKRNQDGGLYIASKGMNVLANHNTTTTDNTYGGMVIPPENIASNGKKVRPKCQSFCSCCTVQIVKPLACYVG